MIDRRLERTALEHPPFDVPTALAPARRRLGLGRMRAWLIRGLGAGSAVAAAILLAGRLHPFPASTGISVGALIVGVAVAGVWSVARWPEAHEAARAVDRHFSLHDRLTTALEFWEHSGPLVLVQRWETGRLVKDLRLTDGAALPVERRDLVGASLGIVLFVAALALPNAPRGSVAASPADLTMSPQARQAALARLTRISRNLRDSLPPSQRGSPEVRAAQQAIARLRQQLQRSRRESSALRAVSQTQEQLQSATSKLHPVSRTATTHASNALRNLMTPRERQTAARGGFHVDAATSRVLQRLADHAPQSTPQREQLARALANSANRIPDARLRQALRQAASALSRNDQKRAQAALRKAAAAISHAGPTRLSRTQLAQARKRLDSVKNAINGLQTKAPPKSRHLLANESNTQFNKGKHNLAAGSLRNDRRNQPGQGGSESAAGTGRSNSPALRFPNQKSNAGGHNQGSHDAQTTRVAHQFSTVYVPGLLHRGTSLSQNGPNGTPRHVPAISYRRVIARYTNTARAALDRSPLPPTLRDEVRRYFSRLSR